MISQGTIWGTFFLVLLLGVAVGLFFWAKKDTQRVTSTGDLHWNRLTDQGFKQIKWALSGVALLLVVVYGFAMYPFSWDYHSWQVKDGTVTQVSNRFVGGGSGSTNQVFVVTIDNQPYSVTDTRMALVNRGDYLKLKCRKDFNYAGTDSFDCAFVASHK